ncbi:hypothetical protein JGC56_03915 [Salmonella enterica subsp. enterica serovar Saintpaul]|nr:hypothetical protein [Salmonella enterica subsp. enterica serovar Saintpaul]
MNKLTLISIILFSVSTYANTTGNDLIDGYRAYLKANDETSTLSGGDMYNGAYYQGFINGTADSSSGSSWCSSPGETISNAQLYDVVGQYLTNHPEKRSQPGNIIINDALSSAFPCS